MKHFSRDWLNEWCYSNNWSDLYIEGNQYWAFPPGAVMPEPIPPEVLRKLKTEKGMSGDEKLWSIGAVLLSIVAAILSYFFKSPMPIGLAFAFDAVTVALLEVEIG